MLRPPYDGERNSVATPRSRVRPWVVSPRWAERLPGPSFGPAPTPPTKPLQKRSRTPLTSSLVPLSPLPQAQESAAGLALPGTSVEVPSSVGTAAKAEAAEFSATDSFTEGSSLASVPYLPIVPEQAALPFGLHSRWLKLTLVAEKSPKADNPWKLAAANAVESRQRRKEPQEVEVRGADPPEQDAEVLPKPETFKPAKQTLSTYEAICLEQKLVPKFLGRLKEAIDGNVFDLGNSGLGDDQLAAALQDSDLVPGHKILRWNLCDTRMGDKGAAMLADIIDADVEAIDLSHNQIGPAGAESLADVLTAYTFNRLRRLDFSANSFGDVSVGAVAYGLTSCPGLLRLDLCKNNLRDGSHIGSLVASHNQLTRISLRRNCLTGAAMALLFEGILENVKAGGQIADVDVAWNNLGSDAIMAAKAIAPVFEKSASLYHCDLSYCCLDSECCAIIADSLRDNHALYGLHMVGNAATMDADGFLLPQSNDDERPQEVKSPHPKAMTYGGIQPGPQGLVGACGDHVAFSADDDLRGRDALEQKTPCWACEGWQRMEIEWPVDPSDEPPKAVWAFTSLDLFRRALRLHPDSSGRRFLAARMVPPSPYRLQVVFQVDSAICTHPGAVSEQLSEPVVVRLRICEELPELNIDPAMLHQMNQDSPRCRSLDATQSSQWRSQNDFGYSANTDPAIESPMQKSKSDIENTSGRMSVADVPLVQVSQVSIFSRDKAAQEPAEAMAGTGWRSVVTDGPGGGAILLPRITETEFKAKAKVKRKYFWQPYKRETQAMFKAALEVDLSFCRVGHMISESEDAAVRAELQPRYGLLTKIYRRISAMDVSGETGFGIAQIQACDLMIEVGICDGVRTKMSDIDRFFIAAKVTPPETKKRISVVNDKTLVRYEFLEFLLRTAYHHFLQSGVASSMAEATRLMLDALEPEGVRAETWMDSYFTTVWREVVDDVFKKHADLLAAIYKRFSGSKTLPGRPKYMSLSEFQELLDLAEVYDASFQSRHSATAFRLGMMFQVDECTSSRFQEMMPMEFQHALGATVFLSLGGQAADNISPLLETLCAEKLPKALTGKRVDVKR